MGLAPCPAIRDIRHDVLPGTVASVMHHSTPLPDETRTANRKRTDRPERPLEGDSGPGSERARSG